MINEITIDPTSPYVNGYVVDYGNGTYSLERPVDPASYFNKKAGGSYYTTKAGDEIDALAQKYYGDSRYWHAIASCNPHVINFIQLEPGIKLYIPNIRQFQR